jgi:hypothetical protein
MSWPENITKKIMKSVLKSSSLGSMDYARLLVDIAFVSERDATHKFFF